MVRTGSNRNWTQRMFGRVLQRATKIDPMGVTYPEIFLGLALILKILNVTSFLGSVTGWLMLWLVMLKTLNWRLGWSRRRDSLRLSFCQTLLLFLVETTNVLLPKVILLEPGRTTWAGLFYCLMKFILSSKKNY